MQARSACLAMRDLAKPDREAVFLRTMLRKTGGAVPARHKICRQGSPAAQILKYFMIFKPNTTHHTEKNAIPIVTAEDFWKLEILYLWNTKSKTMEVLQN